MLGKIVNHPDPKLRGFAFTIIVAFFVLVAWNILPMLTGGGPTKTMSIVNNLRQIEIMKEMWASDHSVTGAVQVSEHDLAPYAFGYSSNGLVKPLIGERYIIHSLGVGPEAQLTRSYGKLPAGTIIQLRPDTNRLFQIIMPNKVGAENSRPAFGLVGSGSFMIPFVVETRRRAVSDLCRCSA